MVSAKSTNPKVPNLSPKPKNAYHVGGIQVEFPYQPYGTQLAFMGRVISTLDRALREGHCHALLESPTGTGKSLSLLCSTLAWQQSYKFKNQYANLTPSNPHPEAIANPMAHGGGFIPETQPSRNLPPGVTEPVIPEATSKKKKDAPTIFYASRTHSQISQVIHEYRKTSYRVPMAVLASRKHYCTNANVNCKENIDEECKTLLKNQEVGCLHFKNANKIKGHPSVKKGGCHEVHDIEDLVKVGQVVKGCPYYAARSMADDAQLVFCPYSYIINPVFRGAMEIDIKGAVIIFDEAHNIEDIARDAGSVDVEEDFLHKLQTELEQLCPVDAMVYQPLYEMTQDLISWIEQRESKLEKRDFQHYYSCWSGDKALRELQEANISQQCFPILLECATKAIREATDSEAEKPHLSGMSVITLEGLFSSLTYFFSRNGSHISDFQLALQRYVKRDKKNSIGGWTNTFSLWCLNPAVVFGDVATLSLSVILTSGTLSPMDSFSTELGVQFGTCLEAPHVVDTESQVLAAVISSGPNNYPLNASYKTADDYAFQDELGRSLEEICKIVPAGSLVFFPSYKLMQKLCNRWCETGQWSRIDARKSLFIEPRGGSQEDFDSLLKSYYRSISQHGKPAFSRKRGVKKAIEGTEKPMKDGAALLAVCRGKVSEGIDFSDDFARVVIVVGIPFPNINDVQVGLKKKYNDTYKTSKNLLSGNEWYCNQAFRALNQAIGRCIRHRFDYGAIILLDERYQEERNRIYISRWLRKSIHQYGNFHMSLERLRSFFRDAKEYVDKNKADVTPNSDTNKGNDIKGQCKLSRGNKTRKNQSDNCGGKPVCVTKCDGTSQNQNSQADAHARAFIKTDEQTYSCRDIIDLECDLQKESRSSDTSALEDPEVTIVKETPSFSGIIVTTSPEPCCKDGNSTSTMLQPTTEVADQTSPNSVSPKPSNVPYNAQNLVVLTPEKEFTVNSCSFIHEVESSLNWSAESHIQKRRKSMHSPLISSSGEQSDVPDAKTYSGCDFTRSSISSRELNRKIEFCFETNSTEHQSSILNSPTTDYGASSNPFTHKNMQMSCQLCKSPLGLPQNHFFVRCLLTSSSKVHLVSLVKERLELQPENTSTCIPVVVTDVSSVDQRLCNSSPKKQSRKGVWCEEDGCVFSSIYCPFCSTSNCLGVQILATNTSNVQLLNKILFYSDRVELQSAEASKEKKPKEKVLTPHNSSGMDKIAILNSIDRFSYSPQQNSGGWRTTKSKMRLPKKG